jgi:hypothetical protein
MPTSGDVVDLDLGVPEAREAGFRHPAILVTAQRILDADPTVVHVVPLTTTIRRFHSEIVIAPDDVNASTNSRPPSANTSERFLPAGSSVFAAMSGPSSSGSCARPSP